MMLRNLLRSFEQALKLHVATSSSYSKRLPLANIQRTLFTQLESNAKPGKSEFEATLGTAEGNSNETDHEDVPSPYSLQDERGSKASVLIDALREYFRLSEAEAQHIMSDELVSRNYRNRSLRQTLDTLQLEGITKCSIVEHPWVLTLEHRRLEPKLNLIKSMRMRDINHFVPFLRLTVPRLRKLVACLNNESHIISQENRIYYISDRLQVSPEIVTKYLCKRLFILEMPYEMFEKNLDHMMHYNVSPINILKDLWAFRYTPKSVELRLERAKRAKKDKIMPWMVRCPETILQRSLKLSLDELEVLGEFGSVVEYVAHRLGFSATEAKAIMDNHPQVHTVRVTKIKEVLDYLMIEEKFSRFEIARVPRILCHSLKTTKARMEELKSLGCRPSSIIILCRSKREYDKFVQTWRSQQYTNSNSQEELNS